MKYSLTKYEMSLKNYEILQCWWEAKRGEMLGFFAFRGCYYVPTICVMLSWAFLHS